MKLRHATGSSAKALMLLFCFELGLCPILLEAVSKPVVPLQPFADQVRQVERALAFYGQPILPQDYGSEVDLASPQTVHATVTVAAYLDPEPDINLDQRPYYEKPYWSLDRARIGGTRKVPVELIVNGERVARREIVADGTVQKLNFDVTIKKSSWMAVRIVPSSHTDPIFVIVGGRPVRASRRSAEWCLAGVNQCWTQKSPLISSRELSTAKQAYDHAREVYRQLIAQCSQ